MKRYSWMLRAEDIEKMAEQYGRTSCSITEWFWERGVCQAKNQGVYSAADIEMSGKRR